MNNEYRVFLKRIFGTILLVKIYNGCTYKCRANNNVLLIVVNKKLTNKSFIFIFIYNERIFTNSSVNFSIGPWLSLLNIRSGIGFISEKKYGFVGYRKKVISAHLQQ